MASKARPKRLPWGLQGAWGIGIPTGAESSLLGRQPNRRPRPQATRSVSLVSYPTAGLGFGWGYFPGGVL